MRNNEHSHRHLNDSIFPVGGSAVALFTLLLLI